MQLPKLQSRNEAAGKQIVIYHINYWGGSMRVSQTNDSMSQKLFFNPQSTQNWILSLKRYKIYRRFKGIMQHVL